MSEMPDPASPSITNVPRHVAIIMDGNKRWARQRSLPDLAGHRAGLESVRKIISACGDYGIETLTLFAFSSENWQRPNGEVRGLMRLFYSALKREVADLHKNHIRLRIIGDRQRFSPMICKRMDEAEALTRNNARTTLVIAADYGGQWDIAQASRRMAEEVAEGRLSPDEITTELMNEYLSLADLPCPDLCIRTGGEQRISNFLLWQMAYTELFFTSTFWPDFRESEFLQAITDFSGRQRRFGRETPHLVT